MLQDSLSEFRKGDFIVQVCGMMNVPSDHAMYARETVITDKNGWSEWEKIDPKMFQYIDKQAANKYGYDTDLSKCYAEFYMDVIL